MTLVLENGSGVTGANSYVSATFVTSYLTDRSRSTENSWSSASTAVKESACIAATDYIENAFRDLFKGQKEFRDISTARSTLTFTAQPTAADTVTLGDVTYTFVAAIAVANDVLIGDTVADSIDNLVSAINLSSSGSGSLYHEDTVENENASGTAFIDDTMVALSLLTGTRGNSVVSTETSSTASWNFATLVGGSDIVKPQPLSFPRQDLFDRDGIAQIGIPDRLQFATSEYAVRARSAALAQDPDVDVTGGQIVRKSEAVGPITESTEYLPGTAGAGNLAKYPAADRLLRDFLGRSGNVVR